MILDDGGDATLLVHLGSARREGRRRVLANPTSEEESLLFAAIKKRLATSPSWYSTTRARTSRA